MSRTLIEKVRNAVVRPQAVLAAAAAVSVLAPSALRAQAALGTPFIGRTSVSFYSSELSRSGGPETTQLYGLVVAHRFGEAADPMRVTMKFRGSARPFDNVNAGVLDVAVNVGVTREVQAIRGLSLAASTGIGLMAWGDDNANTGRSHLTLPANLGASYDIRVKSATLAPFAMGTIARYDVRTYLNDVRQTGARGWDASYTTGASLRTKELVLTTCRIVGEYGMPNKSRWAFSAGVSF